MTVIVANQSSSGLSPKDPADDTFYYFNFAPWLPPGVTLVSATVTVVDQWGMDYTSTMIQSAATVMNTGMAQQMFVAGVLGVTYTVRCKGVFSDGQSETLTAYLTCGPNVGAVS